VKADNEATRRNVEEWFQKYERLNAEYSRKVAAYEKALEEQKSRTDGLIMRLATKGGGAGDAARETPNYEQFMGYLKKGARPSEHSEWVFRPDVPVEIKTLRTDNATQGGYLIPQVMDNEIRKNITEISPVRLFARVRIAPSKTYDVPRRLDIPSATFEGEGDAASNSQSTYGSEQITLWRQTTNVPATLDMMVSSAFDLEREIAADVGEAYAKGEALNFVKGDGVKKPQGFISDSRCEVVQTASSGAMAWDDLIELAGRLKRGQNPWFYMNRRTLASLQKMKSTIGVPIWQPVAGSTPATIWGFPYNSDMIDLDDAQNGSNAKPIVFADLRRGYEIYDLIGISVIRDDVTMADKAITQWVFRRYLTGQVVVPEAIKILKIQ